MLNAHESIQAVSPTRAIMTERRGRQFAPMAISGANPLIAVERLAAQVPVCASKILAEAVKTVEVTALFGRLPTGDERPLFLVGPKIVA